MRIFALVVAPILFAASLAACSPEVGSEAWCNNMKEKAKADWTANEAKEYARSCIFKSDD
jgi:hypothetical protein